MAKKGFTGSEIYIQDKFDEFDFWSRYNNMRPKEGFAQMWKDYKDSTQKEENQLVKIPPIPSSVLKSGLGFILKQLASGKFNQGKRDFLEKIVKPPKPKIKIESPKPFKFSDVGKGSKEYKKLEKEIAEIFSKHSTKHAEGGIAGMLGEPRSGYNGGGSATKTNALIRTLYDAAGGFDGTGKTFSEFMGDVLFEGDYLRRAKGGRIGLADGMSPSERWMRDFFFSERGETYENRMSFKQFEIGPGVGLWNNHIGKAKGGRIGYDNGGPVTQEEYDAYVAEKEGAGEEPMDFETYKIFKIEFPGLAQGGRIGFKEGEGIMSRVGDMVDARNVPYYGGKALQGLVNSAETLSKFPLAAGELGSKLIQQPPKKEMFMEAIENITPGSWSENLGLTSLVEGMGEKRPDDAKTVGNVLGLGTEIAIPTGGALKAGQILLSKASKLMGKVKDGKTLNKLVKDKISDSGQSRRDFMSLVGTSGLMVALKSIGLGGILKGATKVKPSDDVVITLKTFIDDSDVMTEAGPVATSKFGGFFDIESLTKSAAKTMNKIMMPGVKGSEGVAGRAGWSKQKIGDKEGIFEDVALDEGTYILDGLKKAGHKVKLEHWDDTGGTGVDDLLDKFKNSSMYKGTKEGAEHYTKFSEKVKKMTERQKMEYHNSITDDYGSHYSPDVEEFFDDFYGVVKKAEGGRIGYDTGGPTYEDFEEFMEDIQKGTKWKSRQNLLENWEKYKKWKYGDELSRGYLPRDEVAQGGRIGLQTGGPPMTLKRPMFNDGGLTKTIPPERGPNPQGLPSALYNGIMRSRSY